MMNFSNDATVPIRGLDGKPSESKTSEKPPTVDGSYSQNRATSNIARVKEPPLEVALLLHGTAKGYILTTVIRSPMSSLGAAREIELSATVGDCLHAIAWSYLSAWKKETPMPITSDSLSHMTLTKFWLRYLRNYWQNYMERLGVVGDPGQ